MDYGKMAYLKAEEIEARLAPEGAAEEGGTARKSVAVNTFLSANEPITLLTAQSGAGAGMILTLKLSGGDGGRVTLYLNGKKAQTQDYGLSLTFMASLQSGKVEVSVASSVAVNVERADIMLLGGATFDEVFSDIKVDTVGSFLGAAAVRGGEIRLYISDDFKNPALSSYAVLGFGTAADIAGLYYNGESCFAVCYKDLEQNIFLAVAKKDGNNYKLVEISYLFDNVDSFSISRIGEDGGTLAIAFVKDGQGYGGGVKYLGTENKGVKIDSARRAELIKNADPPVVVLSQASKNVIKVSLKELPCGDIIRLRPMAIII